MILDLNSLEDASKLSADICIIGAGAAGITLAREFVGSSCRVLLLEGGGLDAEPESQSLYESEVIGVPHCGIHTGRARVFGGTTTLWAGQALRFDANEFRQRSWIPYSGWPISREELEPYYERAEKVLGLGKRLSYAQLSALCNVRLPAFDTAGLSIECSQWSPWPNLGVKYRRELREADNVSVVVHANATSLVTNSTATGVERVEFRSLSGKQGTARARFYVICCGGIETARLLLVSNRSLPQGLGNRHDLVGRYFQDHLHIRCGEFCPADRKQLRDLFESFFIGRYKYAPKIALTEKIQAQRGLASAHAEIIFDAASDSTASAARELYRLARRRRSYNAGDIRRWLGAAAVEPTEPLRLAYRLYAKRRIPAPRRGAIYLGAQCEAVPNPNSRVTLGESRDRLNMPRAQLDWQVGEIERRTLNQLVGLIATDFERLKLGCFDTRQIDALKDADNWRTMISDSFHHMGTTRMHADPKLGVVNCNCQVHDVSNLYIGSCSVFPTSARSNPTLTALGLCLRIADRLKALLPAGE